VTSLFSDLMSNCLSWLHDLFVPPRCAAYQNDKLRTATTAAINVDTKLTPLFPSNCCRSSVAPSTLSAIMPNTPTPAQTAIHEAGITPQKTQTETTRIAASNPESVPPSVTAPSVPWWTSRQVVISLGLPPTTWPISLETVSAAASASAAAMPASRRRSGQAVAKRIAQAAAAPKLANTWEALRPARLSAVPNRSFLAYPMRVETQVNRKTVNNAPKPPSPLAHNSAKQTMPPANAPEAVTPLAAHPRPAKTPVSRAYHAVFGMATMIQLLLSSRKLFISDGITMSKSAYQLSNCQNHTRKHHI
jgi:hypothetical protein